MPLIHALKNSDDNIAKLIRKAIINGGKQHMDEIMQAIEATDAIAYTENVANQQAQLASNQIKTLPDNDYRNALLALTEFAINRST